MLHKFSGIFLFYPQGQAYRPTLLVITHVFNIISPAVNNFGQLGSKMSLPVERREMILHVMDAAFICYNVLPNLLEVLFQ